MSPDGSGVFVTGQRGGNGIGYQTVAYDGVTGGELWARYFSGRGFGLAEDVAVSPDSSTVYVTGYVNGAAPDTTQYATVAYTAATGTWRWLAVYPGKATGDSQASSVAVSPSGSQVFVTGGGPGGLTTLAYAP